MNTHQSQIANVTHSDGASQSSSREIEIKSRFGDYRVEFMDSFEACLRKADGPGAFFFVDEKVHRLYQSAFDNAGIDAPILWEASEEKKTFAALEGAFDLLIGAGFKKNSRLVVVGGGILQDAGGFVASTIYRGVTWDLIPTTLLAQADSCIGAKTSVNLTRAKNLIGTFSAPKHVYLTPAVLKTLKPEDIRSGLCEAVKLGMVDGPETVNWMQAHLGDALRFQGLDTFLHRALKIKQRFIEVDEFDRGVRNILNYGHTFGHAFESVTHYMIPHGVAVGIGIEAAEYFSMRLGYVTPEHYAHVQECLRPLISDAKAQLAGHSAESMVTVMRSDKKNTSSDITFILSKGYGQLFKQPLPADKALELMREYLG